MPDNPIPAALIEAGAIAIQRRRSPHTNPEHRIGLDKYGYHQEPYVDSAPSWRFHGYHLDAEACIRATIPAAAEAVAVRDMAFGEHLAATAGDVAFMCADIDAALASLDDHPPFRASIKFWRKSMLALAAERDALAERLRDALEALKPFASVPPHSPPERRLLIADAIGRPWHLLQADLDRARAITQASATETGDAS